MRWTYDGRPKLDASTAFFLIALYVRLNYFGFVPASFDHIKKTTTS